MRPIYFPHFCVPSISPIWHPFTVFTAPGDQSTVRILFRATGPFTNQLLNAIQQTAVSTCPPPVVLVDGFYGGTDRVEQALCHDVVVMVAGGVGITPFLSFAPMLLASLSDRSVSENKTKEVTLHWLCRDEGMIDHVVTHYLSPIVETSTLKFMVVIHHTAQDRVGVQGTSEGPTVELISEEGHHVTEYAAGRTFITPAMLSPFGKTSTVQNIVAFLLFSTICWVGMFTIWSQYIRAESNGRIWIQVLFLFLLLAFSFIIFYAAEKRHQQYLSNQSQDKLGRIHLQATLSDTERSVKDSHFKDVRTAKECTDVELAVLCNNPNGSKEFKSSRWHTLRHNQGRPSFERIISDMFEKENAGVFVCGPMSLMREVRDVASRRSCVRCDGRGHCAIYEETFSL